MALSSLGATGKELLASVKQTGQACVSGSSHLKTPSRNMVIVKPKRWKNLFLLSNAYFCLRLSQSLHFSSSAMPSFLESQRGPFSTAGCAVIAKVILHIFCFYPERRISCIGTAAHHLVYQSLMLFFCFSLLSSKFSKHRIELQEQKILSVEHTKVRAQPGAP